MQNILEIKNLTKYYGKVLGVKDLSLILNEGEIFGFIGPNGAGKSTTIRCILNIINKTSGEVLFQGQTLDKNNLEFKKLIGYLPSEISLYDDLTVKEMLDFHESFYDKDLSKSRKKLVSIFKIDENKKVEDLSFGNKKKIGIILAFMHEPKLLILDEPTSGLDPIMQQVFFDLLKEEKQKGTTIFYSTHILAEISKICNRVGIIKNGTLLNVEPIKNMLDKSLMNVTITSDNINKIVKELNITIISKEKNTIKFNNTIDINKLIKTLSKYDIKKILIEPATIEDIVLHYYE